VDECEPLIVGTGGDDAGTVNISTGSCILAAAAGAKAGRCNNTKRSNTGFEMKAPGFGASA
jgi:anthranilate phosphoribosyltransferase